MAGKPATAAGLRGAGEGRTSRALRASVAIAAWLLAASMVHAGMGDDVGRLVRPFEEFLELRVRERSAPPPEPQQHEHTHDDSIEPWELVSV